MGQREVGTINPIAPGGGPVNGAGAPERSGQLPDPEGMSARRERINRSILSRSKLN
jgi:hypothetical protein